MGTTTVKLALYKPGGGSTGTILPDEAADIDKINANMDKIDVSAGFIVCTSTTRPASPFPGQPVIETDTRNSMWWTGARWAPIDTLPNAASASLRDLLYPVPVVGNQVFRTDLGVGGLPQVYSGTGWKMNNSGRVTMIPTTVAGGTINADGSVSFSAVGSLNLNGVFTSDFANYAVELSVLSSTVSAVNLLRLRAAGVDEISALYDFGLSFNSAAVASAQQTLSQTSLQFGAISSAQADGDVTVYRPQQAAVTVFRGGFAQTTQGAASTAGMVSGVHRLATAYDGLSVLRSSGTMTGVIKVYGLS